MYIHSVIGWDVLPCLVIELDTDCFILKLSGRKCTSWIMVRTSVQKHFQENRGFRCFFFFLPSSWWISKYPSTDMISTVWDKNLSQKLTFENCVYISQGWKTIVIYWHNLSSYISRLYCRPHHFRHWDTLQRGLNQLVLELGLQPESEQPDWKNRHTYTLQWLTSISLTYLYCFSEQ